MIYERHAWRRNPFGIFLKTNRCFSRNPYDNTRLHERFQFAKQEVGLHFVVGTYLYYFEFTRRFVIRHSGLISSLIEFRALSIMEKLLSKVQCFTRACWTHLFVWNLHLFITNFRAAKITVGGRRSILRVCVVISKDLGKR